MAARKKIKLPFPKVTGLPPRGQEELWRDFQELGDQMAPGGFVIVSSDGTGDFTKLSDAITAATGNGYIMVLSADDDASDVATLSGNIDLTVLGSSSSLDSFSGSPSVPVALGYITGRGTLRLRNLELAPDSAVAGKGLFHDFDGYVIAEWCNFHTNQNAALIGGSSGTRLIFKNTIVQDGATYNPGNYSANFIAEFYDCHLDELLASGGNVSSLIVDGGSIDQFGPSGTTATVLLTSSGTQVRFSGVKIVAPGEGLFTWQFVNTITNEEVVLFENVEWSPSEWHMAFTNLDNGATVAFLDCVSEAQTGTSLAFTTTGTAKIMLVGNQFKRCDITQTGHHDSKMVVTGIYQHISTVSNGTLVDAILDGEFDSSGSAVTIGGSFSMVKVALPSAYDIGVTVSGDDNIILASGIDACATPSSDSGTGNQINTFTDNRAVHTDDFTHPFVVPDGQADAFKLRHISIAATKPTSAQVPVYNATTKRIEWAAPTDASAVHSGDSAGPWVAGTFPSPRTGPDFTQLFQDGVPGRVSADMIRNIPIASTKPTSNQALKYNATTKRWEPGSVAAVAVPFLVVDAGGSGDFTSIKSAIDSLSTNATANNISGIIYVKQSSSAYSDGSSTVDVAGKQVIIIGQGSATAVGMFSDTGVLTMPKWTFGGFIGASTGNVAIQGMELGATNLTTSVNVNFQLDRCKLASLTNAASISNCNVRDCYFTAAVINVTTHAMSNCIFKGCRFDAGWVIASATVTCSSIVRFDSCLILGQVTTTVSFANGSGSAQFEFVNNAVNVAATTTWTFNKSSTEDHYLFANNNRNGSQTAILTMSFAGSGHGPNAVFDGNNMPYTDLTFANSASDMGLSISGLYRSVTIAQTAVNLSAVLDLRGSSSITALTMSSGAVGCAVSVAVVAGTSSTGYSIASGANNNYVTIANLAGLSTTGTDSGSGNVINGASTSAPPVVAGDFRQPFQTVPSSDATKLRHITIAAGKPGDRQEYRYLDSAKAWVASNPDYASSFLLGGV